jgi:hypothetical protein
MAAVSLLRCRSRSFLCQHSAVSQLGLRRQAARPRPPTGMARSVAVPPRLFSITIRTRRWWAVAAGALACMTFPRIPNRVCRTTWTVTKRSRMRQKQRAQYAERPILWRG